MLPAPLRIPSLRVRTKELPRIIDEYAADIAELSAREIGGRKASFTEADRQWVIEHCPHTVPPVAAASESPLGAGTLRVIAARGQKGAWRMLALRQAGSVARAADLLGMGHTSLGE